MPNHPSDISSILKAFEAAEANLGKLERIWKAIHGRITRGVALGQDARYAEDCRRFRDILPHLPAIDGWRLEDTLLDLDAIAQWRFDAQEIDEPLALLEIERRIEEPGEGLAEYRHRLDRKRRSLLRGAIAERITAIDAILGSVDLEWLEEQDGSDAMPDPVLQSLKSAAEQLETLIGSSVTRPPRWNDLWRHLHFGQIGDLRDILTLDWVSVRPALESSLYGEDDPVPVEVVDLGALGTPRPAAPVPAGLEWSRLTSDDFERLLFSLISAEPGYENTAWLTATNAPDRGRDLSSFRVILDGLGGTSRKRVLIQCRHWLSRSVGSTEVATLREQMRLWEPPRVDVLVIASSGRFTSDAVRLIERHNESHEALRIEMWPESHLERLLSARPALIAEFGLR